MSRILQMTAALLLLPLGAQDGQEQLSPISSSQRPYFEAKVRAVKGTDQAILEDGRSVRLQGLSLPTVSLRPDGFASELQAFLRNRIEGKSVLVYSDEANERGDFADMTASLRLTQDGPSINEEAIAAGLALFAPRGASNQLGALLAAAQRAQSQRLGWFGAGTPRLWREVPFLNGAVLGLHDRAQGSYRERVDELAELGFRHLCLLFSAFVPTVDGVTIDRFHRRTVRDDRLIETIRYAHERGMSVMLLPIVLIDDAEGKDWRGTLRPRDDGLFWQAYERFLAHYLDIAELHGVELFSIGSEYGTLENREAAWRRVIQLARGRYSGALTYSANWDHAHVPTFFPQLDLVGMTAYFSLTKQNDPSYEELVEGWRKVATGEIAKVAKQHGKPVLFTEIGYASLDGINKDPWNYVMNTKVDLGEQHDCLRAFIQVAAEMDYLRGAYLFDYFGTGGPKDKTYSPRGKPAIAAWRDWARR